jgi:putative Mg2+ transporter-C (MgtC) family protein
MGIPINYEDFIKLSLAVLVGGLIGAEREYHDKAAGFRTLILICVGAVLFTILSPMLGGPTEPSRIAAGIVMGVGFLGAGVILQSGGRIIGLTTASTIWLTAALGMAIGAGYYTFSVAVTLVILVVLWFFPRLEEVIDARHEERTYEVISAEGTGGFQHLQTIFADCGVHVRLYQHVRAGAEQTWTWQVNGTPGQHEKLVGKLLGESGVRQFRFQSHGA